MKKKPRLCDLKMKSRLIQKADKSLPKIGQLVKLKNFKSGIKGMAIRLGDITDGTGSEPVYSEGTLALVVSMHQSSSRGTVPVVMVENHVGWIFNDEWERFEED